MSFAQGKLHFSKDVFYGRKYELDTLMELYQYISDYNDVTGEITTANRIGGVGALDGNGGGGADGSLSPLSPSRRSSSLGFENLSRRSLFFESLMGSHQELQRELQHQQQQVEQQHHLLQHGQKPKASKHHRHGNDEDGHDGPTQQMMPSSITNHLHDVEDYDDDDDAENDNKYKETSSESNNSQEKANAVVPTKGNNKSDRRKNWNLAKYSLRKLGISTKGMNPDQNVDGEDDENDDTLHDDDDFDVNHRYQQPEQRHPPRVKGNPKLYTNSLPELPTPNDNVDGSSELDMKGGEKHSLNCAASASSTASSRQGSTAGAASAEGSVGGDSNGRSRDSNNENDSTASGDIGRDTMLQQQRLMESFASRRQSHSVVRSGPRRSVFQEKAQQILHVKRFLTAFSHTTVSTKTLLRQTHCTKLMVFIGGFPGSGKTRLLHEFVRQVQMRTKLKQPPPTSNSGSGGASSSHSNTSTPLSPSFHILSGRFEKPQHQHDGSSRQTDENSYDITKPLRTIALAISDWIINFYTTNNVHGTNSMFNQTLDPTLNPPRHDDYDPDIAAGPNMHKQQAENDEEERRRLKLHILAAIPREADQQLMLNVIPGLSLVLGRDCHQRGANYYYYNAAGNCQYQESDDGQFNGVGVNIMHFKSVFERLLRAIGTFSERRPMLFLLDDMQWSDSLSRDVLSSLVMDRRLSHFFFIGAFRSNEVAPPSSVTGTSRVPTTTVVVSSNDIAAQSQKPLQQRRHPLMVWMKKMQFGSGRDGQPVVQRMHLENHSHADIKRLISSVLRLDTEEVEPLSSIVFKKTAGNIRYAKHAMKELRSNDMLKFSFLSYRWEWGDLVKIEDSLTISYNLVDLNVVKLQFLPTVLQAVLTVAAFLLRKHFDVSTIHEFLNDPRVTQASAAFTIATIAEGFHLQEHEIHQLLDTAVQEGLLEKSHSNGADEAAGGAGSGDKKYRFSHERIQQVAQHALITADESQLLRLQLGKFLLAGMTTTSGRYKKRRPEWRLFVAATHLNEIPLSIFHDDNDVDLMDIANLNLNAGIKAVKHCAFPSACEYFGKGIQALEMKIALSSSTFTSWQLYYGVAYKLYSESANARHVVGDYEVCRDHSQLVLKNAKTIIEKLPVYKCLECCLSRQGKHSEAMKLIVAVVKSLGALPERYMKITIFLDVMKARLLLGRHTDDQIVALPYISDPIQLVTMDFLSRLARRAALAGDFQTMVASSLRALIFTFKYGLCGDSAVAIASCGRIYCTVMGDRGMGHRLGRLATMILGKCHSKHEESWVNLLDGFFISAASAPLTECLKTLQYGFKGAVEAGEVEGAGWNGYSSNITAFQLGFPLKIVHETGSVLMEHYVRYKISSCHDNMQALIAHYEYLMGVKKPNWQEIEADITSGQYTKGNEGMGFLRLLQACLAYRLGNLDVAEKAFRLWRRRQGSRRSSAHQCHFGSSTTLLFQVLIASSLYRQSGKGIYRFKARKANKEICRAVKAGALNDLHKAYIMDAEFSASFYRQRPNVIQKKFDLAIQLASRAGFTQDAALANELAGEAMLRANERHQASEYLTRAYSLYTEWGAQAKVEQLVAKHGLLVNREQSTVSSNDSKRFLSDKYRTSLRNSTALMQHSLQLDRLPEYDGDDDYGSSEGESMIVSEKDEESKVEIEATVEEEEGVEQFFGMSPSSTQEIPNHRSTTRQQQMSMEAPWLSFPKSS